MIARIKTERGTVYDTVVFALIVVHRNNGIIGFDEDLTHLQFIPIFRQAVPFHRQKQVAVIDLADDGWVAGDHIEGYRWIVDNKPSVTKILQGQPLPDDLYERCKALQEAVPHREWLEITDKKTAWDMQFAFAGIPSSFICAIDAKDGYTTIAFRVVTDTVYLRLENAQLSESCKVGYGKDGEIFTTSVEFENGRIIWQSQNQSTEPEKKLCQCSGTRMEWKIEMD
ncbi:MAG: hypothetical protein IJW98_08180 [Clostridia bacterium]|nr:hypothetical protein [Clostridia bacterium]